MRKQFLFFFYSTTPYNYSIVVFIKLLKIVDAMSKSIFTELLSLSYPSLPFFDFVPEGVCVGTVIYIEGHIPQNSKIFCIDLIDGQNIDEQTPKYNDIPIEIYIKFDEKLIIRNTRRDGEWGKEETNGFSVLKKGIIFL